MSQPARQREDVAPEPPRPEETELVTLEDVQQDKLISTFISGADRVMEGLGFTEYGFRHASLSARIAYNVLSRLGFDERTAVLACLGGYLHDVGNLVARENHGQIGALLAYDALKDRMHMADLAQVMGAVGNHEEDEGGGPASWPPR